MLMFTGKFKLLVGWIVWFEFAKIKGAKTFACEVANFGAAKLKGFTVA